MRRGSEEGALAALAAPHDGRPRPPAASTSETYTMRGEYDEKSHAEEKEQLLNEGMKVAKLQPASSAHPCLHASTVEMPLCVSAPLQYFPVCSSHA